MDRINFTYFAVVPVERWLKRVEPSSLSFAILRTTQLWDAYEIFDTYLRNTSMYSIECRSCRDNHRSNVLFDFR